MRFQECLRKIDPKAFQEEMEKQQITEEEQALYFGFIERLKQKTARNSELVLDCRVEETGFDEDEPMAIVWDKETSYAIDFTPWEEVLGYLVKEEAIDTFGLEAFCFYALYDMSFDGFQEDERNENIEHIMNRVNEIEPNPIETGDEK